MSLHRITEREGNTVTLTPGLNGSRNFGVIYRDGKLVAMEGYDKEEKHRVAVLVLVVGSHLVSPVLILNKTEGGLSAVHKIGKVMAIVNGREAESLGGGTETGSVSGEIKILELEALSF